MRVLIFLNIFIKICFCFLIVAILVSVKAQSTSHSVMSDSLQPHGLFSPWNSPGQNPGVGSLALFQGIFPTQESNPGLPHCRRILYQLSHKGSPRVLGWVAYPFSSGSSRPRNRTGVSCIAGGFFNNWAMREAHLESYGFKENKSLGHGHHWNEKDRPVRNW